MVSETHSYVRGRQYTPGVYNNNPKSQDIAMTFLMTFQFFFFLMTNWEKKLLLKFPHIVWYINVEVEVSDWYTIKIKTCVKALLY